MVSEYDGAAHLFSVTRSFISLEKKVLALFEGYQLVSWRFFLTGGEMGGGRALTEGRNPPC